MLKLAEIQAKLTAAQTKVTWKLTPWATIIGRVDQLLETYLKDQSDQALRTQVIEQFGRIPNNTYGNELPQAAQDLYEALRLKLSMNNMVDRTTREEIPYDPTSGVGNRALSNKLCRSDDRYNSKLKGLHIQAMMAQRNIQTETLMNRFHEIQERTEILNGQCDTHEEQGKQLEDIHRQHVDVNESIGRIIAIRDQHTEPLELEPIPLPEEVSLTTDLVQSSLHGIGDELKTIDCELFQIQTSFAKTDLLIGFAQSIQKDKESLDSFKSKIEAKGKEVTKFFDLLNEDHWQKAHGYETIEEPDRLTLWTNILDQYNKLSTSFATLDNREINKTLLHLLTDFLEKMIEGLDKRPIEGLDAETLYTSIIEPVLPLQYYFVMGEMLKKDQPPSHNEDILTNLQSENLIDKLRAALEGRTLYPNKLPELTSP